MYRGMGHVLRFVNKQPKREDLNYSYVIQKPVRTNNLTGL